jgi:hypothetical protein
MKHPRARSVLLGAISAVVVAGAAGITATAFAGTSAASLNDDFSDGSTAGWSKSGGNWSVADGALQQSDVTSDLAREFAGDTGWTDYTLQARVSPGTLGAGSAAGIAARVSGAHEFERLVLVAGGARLEEVRGSAVTTLGTATLSPSGWHTLRLDVSGSRVTGTVDGVLVGDASGRSLTTGRIGVQTVHASAAFDDVQVEAAGSSPAPSPSVSSAAPTASPSPTKTASPSPSKTTSSPTAAWPTATSTTTLHATREISGTFDGGNAEFVAGSELGDGDQSEDQKPLFELAAGSTLSNVIIGAPGADGVHCLGTCLLKNVWWLDVGEDAATQKGSTTSEVMTIDGGGAQHADDKVFQHNGPGTFIIQNFQAEDIGKLYRSCGNCSKQFARHVEVSNVTVTAPLKDLVGINPNLGDTAKITGVTVIGSSSKTVICASFTGVTSGEPVLVSTTPNASCTATDITLK